MSLTTVDGRYQVIARIASGGMGEVFHAHDAVLAREVAVKLLLHTFASDQAFVDRFRREARAAANLSHPNIVQVYDWGERDGASFMIMEYVRGPNLRDLLSAHGRLEPAQAVEVLLQMLAGLGHAHGRGIVHRDVKPENALLTQDGVVKVADFGLAHALAEARMTQSPGTVTGTVHYLAPEQIQGEPADPRTDLYALGIVAYELLTGHTPFTAETSLAVAYKHLSDVVPPPSRQAPDVPPGLDRIVLQATAKDPDDRPGSAAEMRQELIVTAGSVPSAPPLRSLVASTPEHELTKDERATTVTIPQVVAPRRHRLRRRRRRWPWAVLALLAVLGSGAWAAWTYAIPHYAKAPSVLGLRLSVARERMVAAGLHVKVGRPTPSIRYSVRGTVARQSVVPGARVHTGSDVLLQLSSGPPIVRVPDVRGLTQTKARAKLDGAHFIVKVAHRYSQTVAKGEVISQSPDPHERLRYGTVVHLEVSAGPEPVNVPSVQGKSADEATAVLEQAGFQVQRIDRFSEAVPLGDVIRQHPSSGTALKGSTVTLVVSRGPRSFPMPNVEGSSRGAADHELTSLGLDVHVVVIPSSSGNTVVGQNPSPGTTMHRGDSVTVYVA